MATTALECLFRGVRMDVPRVRIERAGGNDHVIRWGGTDEPRVWNECSIGIERAVKG